MSYGGRGGREGKDVHFLRIFVLFIRLRSPGKQAGGEKTTAVHNGGGAILGARKVHGRNVEQWG